MNVNDVAIPEVPESSDQQAINVFKRQSELEASYWSIEKRYAPFININDRKGQVLIKDFLWRITEELGEAIEAQNNMEEITKVHEELADALHFVTGLCVITDRGLVFKAGWSDSVNSPNLVKINTLEREVVEALSKVGNCLKMKPWKQTDMSTDEGYFDLCLHDLVVVYLNYCFARGLNNEWLYQYYMRKSEVNLFRIRSKY